MERRIKLTEADVPKHMIIHFADGTSATIRDYEYEKGTLFILAKGYEEELIKINVDQLLPFGKDFYAFGSAEFEQIPVGFLYSHLSHLLKDPTDYDISVLAHLHSFLDTIVKPAKMGKVSELQGKVLPGDVLYYLEDGKAYPTIVRNVKNNVAETIYMYDSMKISDCDKYNLDLNDGEIRHIATRDYPSIRHVLAEVEQNSAGNITGNIRPFLNEDVAAQMIDSLVKES
ncbi:hypothetical protein [Yersinia ruckeri]|uniref:hypothetical protein n=1 Tax=Yersinia ruckeri TaxID=29486 RepID=UPI002237E696|nr:hypothetical protein [Yersinia ruckeri]MCW6598889.1 hypothetical protein [Yersinia ruckeri]